jgi:hypothetical protein
MRRSAALKRSSLRKKGLPSAGKNFIRKKCLHPQERSSAL